MKVNATTSQHSRSARTVLYGDVLRPPSTLAPEVRLQTDKGPVVLTFESEAEVAALVSALSAGDAARTPLELEAPAAASEEAQETAAQQGGALSSASLN